LGWSSAAARTSLETPRCVGVGQPLGADELQGHHPAQLPVAGLEHLAHAAFAEALQEDVGAQQQFAALALEELIGLKGGQPAPPDQLTGQRLGFREDRL
jgi:hypothetical protein